MTEHTEQQVTAPTSGHLDFRARRSVLVSVVGLPAPQGSKRHVGRGIMVESSKRVRPWREAVKQATLDVLTVGPVDEQGMAERVGFPFDREPVVVDVVFRLPRPRSHFRTGRHAAELRGDAPTLVSSRPDVDKLLRSTLDALGEAGMWSDDCQVAGVVAVKMYAAPAEVAGAQIVVRAA